MANRKKVLFAVLALAIALCAGYYYLNSAAPKNAKGLPGGVPAAKSDIGYVDVNQAIRVHPKYQTLVQLKKEYNDTADAAQSRKGFRVESPVPSADLSALGESARQERNQKITAKHAELNERLKQRESELAAQLSAERQAEAQAIDDLYYPLIFNLQLKLDTLRVDQETAAKILEQINALKQEHSDKARDAQRKFAAAISERMRAEQEKASEELNQYAAAIDRELGAATRQKQEEIEARNRAAVEQKVNEMKRGMADQESARQELQNKQREIAALEEAIQKDIADKVEKLAIERKLTTVLSMLRVNVSAVDLTDLVVEEFKKQS